MDRLLAEPSWGMLNFVRRSFVYEVAMILGMSPSVADFVALTQYRPEWFEESRWFGFVLGRDDTAQSGFSMFVVAKDMYPMAIGLSKLVASVGSVSPQGLPVSDYRIGVAKYAKGAACYGLQQWKDANSVEEQQPDVKEEPASALVAGESMPMSIAKRVCAEDPEQVVGLVGYCYLLAVRPEKRLEVLGALGASPTYAELSSVDPACLQPAAEFERLGAAEVPGGWHWFRTTSTRVVPVSQVCGKKDSVPEWVWKELVQSRYHCDVRRMWTAELNWHELSGLPVSYFVSPLRAWSFGFVWHYDRGWCLLRSSCGLSVPWAARAEAEQRVGKDEFLSRFLAYIGLPEEHTEGVYEAGLGLVTRGRPVVEAEALGRYGLFRAGAALDVLSATAGAMVVPMALSKASLADMALQFDTGGIDASQFMGGLFAVVARLGGQPLLVRFLQRLGACDGLEGFERPLCIASFSNSALVLCKKSLEVVVPGHSMEHVGLGTACVTSDWKQLEVPEGLSVLVATEDDVRRVKRMMPTVVDKAVNVSTVRATRGRTFRHVWLVRFGANWDSDTWNNEDWARVATSRHTSSFTYIRCDGVTDYVERWASSDSDSVFPL